VNDDRKEFRVEVREASAVRLGDSLQHASDVFHVVEVDDGVVDRADDLHGVVLQHLAAAQFGHRLVVFQLCEHRLDVAVRLEQPAAAAIPPNRTHAIAKFGR